MPSQSVINKVPATINKNFAAGTGKFDPGKIRGVILHPNSADLLSIANLATPALRQTALQALIANNTPSTRAIFIHKLHIPTSNGEAPGRETRGQLKTLTDKGTWDMSFVVECTWGEYQSLLNIHLAKGYLAAFVDENWNLQHLNTATGICGFSVHQIEVLPFTEPDTGKAVKYELRIALSDIDEKKRGKHTHLGFNPFHPLSGLRGVEDTIIEKIGDGSAGVFYIALYSLDGETNYVDTDLSGILNVASGWKLVNASGLAVTISGVTILSSGTEKIAFILTCTTTGNYGSAGDTLYLSQAAVQTLAGLGVKYQESNVIPITAT